MLNSPDQILILRPGAVGDTLLTFPAIIALRRRFPKARIQVIGNRAALAIGAATGIVDQYDAFGADWVSDLFGDVPTPAVRERLASVDLGVVWMHAAEAAQDLAFRLERSGVRHAVPLVSFPPTGSRRHVADHLVATLVPLGIPASRPEVPLRTDAPPGHDWPNAAHAVVPVREDDDARQIADSADGVFHRAYESERKNQQTNGEEIFEPFVVLHPGAGGRRKRWSPQGFAALADRLTGLGFATAITSGPADEDAVRAVLADLRLARPRILAGLPLDRLARVIAHAALFVGNDSGITHLAAMLDVPTVAIFGPFDPAYWAPLGAQVAVVDAGRSCPHRDDPRDGCRACDLLSPLEVETVWDAAQALIPHKSAIMHGASSS